MSRESIELLNGLALIFIIFYLVLFLISLAVAVLNVIAQWRLFEKAGEHGWASLIPMYNYFVMVKIATGNYTLGWVYLAISIAYMFLSAVGSVILELSGSEHSLAYIGIMVMAFLLIVPVYVIAGYTSYMFSKSYGKPTIWNVCMIFLSPILMIIMGFSKNTYYVGPKGIPRNFL